ncbi:MAG: helix-turn-helix transcriptional regulator [Sphingomonas sp.]|nr:helix-turn-helix transcriptional regulator [Sphingomonas sp.]
MVTVSREQALRLTGAAGGSLDALAILTDRPMRDPLLAELCRRLEDEPSHNPVVREWAYGILFASLVRLAGRVGARHQSPVLTQERFNEVLAAIDANIGERLSIAHLADVSGLPRRSFTAAFRGMTGLPVHQFVLRRRAEKAAELIARSDIPLAEVAHLAGFAHQAHMNRVVTRLKGRSPGRLRLEARKSGPPPAGDL